MKIKNALVMIISPLLILASCSPAIADIIRRCNGYYRVDIIGYDSAPGVVNLPKTLRSSSPLGLFEGIGECGNRTVADRCRRRARDKAHVCMNAHWRSAESLPDSCMTSRIQNYSIFNLRVFLEYQAVSEYKQYGFINQNNTNNISKIEVWAVTTGDDGCDREVQLGNVPERIWRRE